MSNTTYESGFQKVYVEFGSEKCNALNALNHDKKIDFSKTHLDVTDIVEYWDISDVMVTIKFGDEEPDELIISGDNLAIVEEPSFVNEDRTSGITAFEGRLTLNDPNDVWYYAYFYVFCSKLTGICTVNINSICISINNENQSLEDCSSFGVPSIEIKVVGANILAKFSNSEPDLVANYDGKWDYGTFIPHYIPQCCTSNKHLCPELEDNILTTK